jgi:hypothetical protein
VTKNITAKSILALLLDSKPTQLHELPPTQGMYALFDHTGQPRYIGVTEMGLRKRVLRYHVGGDGNSHKFSNVYNAGRMFHTRNDAHTDEADGPVAKELRRLFARAHCRAAGVPLPALSKPELFATEAEVRRIAPAMALAWNDVRALDAHEPEEQLDSFLRTLRWPVAKLNAVERQAERWRRKTSGGGETIWLIGRIAKRHPN